MISQVMHLVRDRTGLQIDSKKEYVTQIFQRLIRQRGLNEADLMQEIREEGTAWRLLLAELTVKETYFFRESDHMNLLAKRTLTWLQRNPQRRIRVVSAGCASGEEPYTLAILLRELVGRSDSSRVEIIGMDIDSSALERARLGIYRRASMRNLDPPRIARYFTQIDESRFQLDESIRRSVQFSEVNLIDPSWPTTLGPVDGFLYRNVSIYFDDEIRDKVLGHFEQALTADGVLIVGTSETLANHPVSLKLRQEKGVFFFCREATPSSSPAPVQRGTLPRTVVKPQAPAPVSPKADHFAGKCLNQLELLTQQRQFEEALQVLEQKGSGLTQRQALFHQAHLLFLSGRLEEAWPVGQSLVAHEAFDVSAHILLGMIAEQRGDQNHAINSYRKAVFVETGHWLPHFLLAEIYYRQSNRKAALREYRAAQRHLQSDSAAKTDVNLLPLSYSLEDIVKLCEFRLSAQDADAGGGHGV